MWGRRDGVDICWGNDSGAYLQSFQTPMCSHTNPILPTFRVATALRISPPQSSSTQDVRAAPYCSSNCCQVSARLPSSSTIRAAASAAAGSDDGTEAGPS